MVFVCLQLSQLSVERVSFGNMPLFSQAHRMVFVINRSKTRPISFQWHVTSQADSKVSQHRENWCITQGAPPWHWYLQKLLCCSTVQCWCHSYDISAALRKYCAAVSAVGVLWVSQLWCQHGTEEVLCCCQCCGCHSDDISRALRKFKVLIMFFSSDSAMFTLIWLSVGTELRTPHHRWPGGEIERVLNNLLWKDEKGPFKGQERAFLRMRKSLWKDKKGPLKNEKGPLIRHERAFKRMRKDIWKDKKGPLKGWGRAFERTRKDLWKDEKGPLSVRQTLELQLKGSAGECWIIKSISLYHTHKRQGGTLGLSEHEYIYTVLNWTELNRP